MIRYVFRGDEPLRIKNAKTADPQIFGEAMAAVAAKHGGQLDPDDLWREARDELHPLHDHYEWDLQQAAEAHWRETSRVLIRIVRIVDESTNEGHVRAYISVTDRGGASYRTVSDVKSSAVLQALVLQQADRDLAAFERRYSELNEVCDAVRDARKKIAKKRQGGNESHQPA